MNAILNCFPATVKKITLVINRMMTNWIIFKMLDIYCLVGRLIMTKSNITKSERFTVGINNFLKGKMISLLDNYSNCALKC